MRDEHFRRFIDEFGEATFREAVPESCIARFEGRLPARLLGLWRDEGWCAHGDGLFWTVDPARYEAIVDAWLHGTRFQAIDTYHALARSAFGHLYLWGERHRRHMVVACPTHSLIGVESQLRSTATDASTAMGLFFSCRTRANSDITDVSGRGLFRQALQKLGPLGPDDIYAFDPPLATGGMRRVEQLRCANLVAHLSLLRAVQEPCVPGAAPGTLMSR